MLYKFIRQNIVILISIILLLLLFMFLSVFYAYQIYDKEKQMILETEDSFLTLLSDKVNNFIDNSKQELKILMYSPSILDYAQNNFYNSRYQKEISIFFYEILNDNNRYHSIKFLDYNGQEKIVLERNEKSVIIEKDNKSLKNLKEYDSALYNDISTLENKEIFTSSIKFYKKSTSDSYLVFVEIAVLVSDSNNLKKGIIVLDVDVRELLRDLPPNMFIQTEDNNLISLNANEEVEVKKSEYNFTGNQGIVDLGSEKGVHFKKIEYSPNKSLTIAIEHSHLTLTLMLDTILLLIFSSILLLSCIVIISLFTNFRKFRNIINSNKAIILSLAKLAEYRDGGTGLHLERSRKYAIIITEELKKNTKFKRIINNEFLEDLYDSAPMHDIGKVGVRDSILLKNSSLTVDEYEEIKNHVLIGSKIIEDIINKYKTTQSFFKMGRNIIKYHHEKFDGSGYPEQLKGESIPLEARIFSVADVYDVIRSKRPYKEPLSHEEAIERLKISKFTHFDPEIIDSFLNCSQKILEVSKSFNELPVAFL